MTKLTNGGRLRDYAKERTTAEWIFFLNRLYGTVTFRQFYHARSGVREVAQASTWSKPHADPQREKERERERERERECVCVCVVSNNSFAGLFHSPFLTCARRNKTS